MSHPSSHNHKMSIMFAPNSERCFPFGLWPWPSKRVRNTYHSKGIKRTYQLLPPKMLPELNSTQQNWELRTEALSCLKYQNQNLECPLAYVSQSQWKSQFSVLGSPFSVWVWVLMLSPNSQSQSQSQSPSRPGFLCCLWSFPCLLFFQHRHTLRKRDNGSNHAGQELSPHRSSYG